MPVASSVIAGAAPHASTSVARIAAAVGVTSSALVSTPTTGRPAMMRAVAGLRRPRFPGRGQDVAGVVEAVGPGVAALRPGDTVFGEIPFTAGRGTFAEYVSAPADVLVPAPARLTVEQAGAMPMAGLAAHLSSLAGVIPRVGEEAVGHVAPDKPAPAHDHDVHNCSLCRVAVAEKS